MRIDGNYLAGTNPRPALAALFGGAPWGRTRSADFGKVKRDWDAWNSRPLEDD